MNLPNKLTMLRILLIPVFMVFVELDSLSGHMLWAFAVFVAASLTSSPTLANLWTRWPTRFW